MRKNFKIGMGIRLDTPTHNGRVYPKEIFIKVLEDAINKPSKLPITFSDPNNFGTIQAQDSLGFCSGFEMDDNNNVTLDATFFVSSNDIDLSSFDLFPCGYGSVRDGVIQDDYKLQCVSLRPSTDFRTVDKFLKPNEYFKPMPIKEFIAKEEMEI